LNSFSKFNTPSGPELGFNKDYQSNDYVFNTQPMKRPNETFSFFDDNKKAKYNDFNRINNLMNTVDLLMGKITTLELKVLQLEEDNTSFRNQNINVDTNHFKENITQLSNRIVLLENLNIVNQVEMTDETTPNQMNIRSYTDCFKIDINKKITAPVHDILNIISNNEQE
jgi:hypothetical protein